MITRKNYEKYVIDYLEGNLKQQIKAEFEKFLENNPDIKEEIFSINEISLQANDQNFSNKWKLKKSEIPDLSYIEQLIISEVEGIATPEEKQELAKIALDNPDLYNELNSYKNTRLKAPTVFYPYKNKLKKTTIGTTVTRIFAYAAMIILAFSIFTLWQKTDTKVATSLSIPQDNVNLLLPADFTIHKKINRPVIVTDNNTKPLINKKTSEPIKHPKTKIIDQTVAKTEIKEQIFSNITSKEFSINQKLGTDINISYKTNLPPTYSNIILAKNISSKLQKKIDHWTKERGIIVSRNNFIIRINNKNYGISIAGR